MALGDPPPLYVRTGRFTKKKVKQKPVGQRTTYLPKAGIGGQSSLSVRLVVPKKTHPPTKTPATVPKPIGSRATYSTPAAQSSSLTQIPTVDPTTTTTNTTASTAAGGEGNAGLAALLKQLLNTPTGGDPFKLAAPLVQAQIAAQQKAAQLSLEQQRAQAYADAQRVNALYQGAAQAIRSLGGPQAAQGAYQGAATQSAAFAKGFSDGMQKALGGTGGQINAALAAVGAPAGQQVDPGQATMAGNVLYGTSGYIPAQSLEQQGASAYSTLAGIPQATIGTGAFMSAGQLSNAQKALSDWYKGQLATISANRPTLLADSAGLYSNIQGQKSAAQSNRIISALGIANQYPGINPLTGAPTKTQATLDYQLAQADVRTRNTLASLYGADPVTGTMTLSAKKFVAAQVKAAAGPKATVKQIQTANKTAGQIASQAFNGFYHLDGSDSPLTQAQLISMMNSQQASSADQLKGVSKSGLTYQEAIRKILAEIGGTPNALTIAQRALNALWVRAGYDYTFDAAGKRIWVKAATGRPLVPFQIRIKRKKA